MRILVTGGCGFIGSHLVDGLVQAQHEVRVLDSLEYQVHEGRLPGYLNPSAEYIFSDIRDEDTLRRAIADIDVIFHHVAAVGVGQSMYEIKKYTEVNVMGTAKLLELLVNRSHNVSRLIVASSMSVYGEGAYLCSACGPVNPRLRIQEQLKNGDWEMKCPRCRRETRPLPTSEEKQLFPSSVYAITKRDQEEMCLAIGRAYELPTVALRYFNVYGPRQSLNNPYTGVAAIFSTRIKNDKPPLVFEDGLQSRDFIDIRDVVRANLLAIEKKEADYEMFNVGTGKPTTILDIARLLIKLYGKKLEPKIMNKYRIGDIRHCYADISKIRKLGFEPEIDLEQGMRELVAWGNTVTALDRTEQAQRELRQRGLVEV
jgi:dTDP-L-rhamnose 4-epimerase